MEQLPRLQARVANLQDLRDLIRALRALAASHVQEAQSALPGIRTYTEAVEDSIAKAASLVRGSDEPLRDLPREGADLLIAVCSEHGFVGAYNERVLNRTDRELGDGRELIVVGRRGAVLADERGLDVRESIAMATHAGGVVRVARALADRLEAASSVRAVFAKHRRVGVFDVVARQIFPLDPALLDQSSATGPPLHHLPPQLLLERLADEYVFGEAARILMEAFASENSSRLRVMESADRNIEEKLDDARQESIRLRQEIITSELLDIVTGSEAIIGSVSGLNRQPQR